MYKSKKFEDLTISDDFMFGIVMRDPKYCKPFLETILNIKISRIEYPEDQKTINLSLDAKSIRLDVYVEDDFDTVYNIEMQKVMKAVDLGAEAIRKLYVENFPAIVVIDQDGNNLYETSIKKFASEI